MIILVPLPLFFDDLRRGLLHDSGHCEHHLDLRVCNYGGAVPALRESFCHYLYLRRHNQGVLLCDFPGIYGTESPPYHRTLGVVPASIVRKRSRRGCVDELRALLSPTTQRSPGLMNLHLCGSDMALSRNIIHRHVAHGMRPQQQRFASMVNIILYFL